MANKICNEKELREVIEKIIAESKLSFKQVDSVLSYLCISYRDKANNFINSTKIQEVISVPRFSHQNKN